jgi:hypothetical protein
MTTFVSTARMSFGGGSTQAGLQLCQRFTGSAFREKRSVDFRGGMGSRPPDNDSFTVFLPFEHRARRESELAPDLDRHGDLTLSCQFGRGERHAVTLPR